MRVDDEMVGRGKTSPWELGKTTCSPGWGKAVLFIRGAVLIVECLESPQFCSVLGKHVTGGGKLCLRYLNRLPQTHRVRGKESHMTREQHTEKEHKV